jgi:hypothetical protein
MKISKRRFVIIFLVSAFAFNLIFNLILGPVINGDWYPGTDSPITWKHTVASIIYPVKSVLVGPLAQVLNDPDPAPPIRIIACAVYWTIMALVIYYILDKIIIRKKHEMN